MVDYVAMDIGNSQTSCGLFKNNKLSSVWHCKTAEIEKSAKQIDSKATVLICSVVPEATTIITKILKTHDVSFKKIQLNESVLPKVYSGMGTDRYADAIAARQYYSNGKGALVIDFGTATTLTAVSPDGSFAGGYISLGLGSTISYLSKKTALLPKLSVTDQTVLAEQLAFNTENALIDGSVLAHIGLIDTWIKAAKKSIGQSASVVITGGWSNFLGHQKKFWDYLDPDLTIKGIFLINALEADLKDPA